MIVLADASDHATGELAILAAMLLTIGTLVWLAGLSWKNDGEPAWSIVFCFALLMGVALQIYAATLLF